MSVVFIFLKNWKNWKIENMLLSVERKLKNGMSKIKAADRKKCHVEKKRFLRKMLVWIKDDRDSVTRPKSENVGKIEKN